MGNSRRKKEVRRSNRKTLKGAGFMDKFSFAKKAEKLQEVPTVPKSTTYDASVVTGSTQDERRTTEAALGRGAELYGEASQASQKSMKEQFGISNIKKDIQTSKNVASALFVAKAASKALAILPGGEYVSAALSMAQMMAEAYTKNLKFKELMYDTMNILTNCYKIFSLINRSTDVFLIAIHNPTGLDELFELLLQRSEIEKTMDRQKIDAHEATYETTFMTALQVAQKNKEENRKKLESVTSPTMEKLASLTNEDKLVNAGKRLLEQDPHYLLYNIHQSSEIKEEIKRKMKDLMSLLLESAPDDVILTLFLDKTLKQRGIGDAVAAECLRRRTDKGHIRKSEDDVKKNIKNESSLKTSFGEILEEMKQDTWTSTNDNIKALEQINVKIQEAYKKAQTDDLLTALFYLEDLTAKYKLGKKSLDEEKFCYKPGNDDENEKRIKAAQILGAIKEDQEKEKVKGFFSRSMGKVASVAKSAVSPQTYMNMFNKVNEITEAEEKMMDVLTALSVINGLFIVMKTQYDEAMRYYEKHLDLILTKDEGASFDIAERYNIFVRGRDASIQNPTTFEKANYMIELSPEYINFLVPPSLQSIMNEAINQTSSDVIDKVMETTADDVEKSAEAVDKAMDKAMDEAEKEVGSDGFYESATTANAAPPVGGKRRKSAGKRRGRKSRQTRKSRK